MEWLPLITVVICWFIFIGVEDWFIKIMMIIIVIAVANLLYSSWKIRKF